MSKMCEQSLCIWRRNIQHTDTGVLVDVEFFTLHASTGIGVAGAEKADFAAVLMIASSRF